jgi:hypothetical protein
VAGGTFKANPWVIVRLHWATYVDARDGKPRLQDWMAFAFPPVVTCAVSFWRDIELSGAASAALLTISGLLSAFLFGVVTQISGRAMDWADTQPPPGRATSAHATRLLEMAANAGYASLICIAAAIAFAVASTVSSHPALRISSAVGLALAVHLVLIMLMVLRRQFLLTQERLGRARTGADLDERVAGRS